MTPTLTIYENQLSEINSYINTIKQRIRKIDQTEYTDVSIKQREFLNTIVTHMEAQRNLVNDIVVEYAKELERFAEVEIELNRVKLLNDSLIKRMALMGEIRLRLGNVIE